MCLHGKRPNQKQGARGEANNAITMTTVVMLNGGSEYEGAFAPSALANPRAALRPAVPAHERGSNDGSCEVCDTSIRSSRRLRDVACTSRGLGTL